MICYHGFRGNGKTLNVAIEIFKLWRSRKGDLRIITNTPFTFQEYKNIFGNQPYKNYNFTQFLFSDILDIQPFFEYAKTYPELFKKYPTVVFIDEANLVMPSRKFDKLPGFVLAFLAESRKFNVHIYYTTQHPARVDKVLRELTEEFVKCQKRLGGLFFEKTHQALDPNSYTPIEEFYTERLFFSSRYYGIYDTMYLIDLSKFTDEKNEIPPNPEIVKFLEENYNESYKKDIQEKEKKLIPEKTEMTEEQKIILQEKKISLDGKEILENAFTFNFGM